MPADLRERLEELVAPPARERFREELYERAAARERVVARRWRLGAIVATVVAVAAASGAGVLAFGRGPALAGTVDRTVSCPVAVAGGVPVFTLRAEPATTTKLFGKLAEVAAQLHVQTGLAGFGTSTELVGLTSFARGWADPDPTCRKAAQIPLARSGLPHVGDFTRNGPGLDGDSGVRCLSGSSITMRIRVKLAGGSQPVAAQLAIRTGKKQRPLAYVDWTPNRISVYTTGDCT